LDIRHLVVISDLHIGSSVALMPPEHTTEDGNIIQANELQSWIWQKWRYFWDECVPTATGNEGFATVINGDIVDGDHHGTFQLVTRNMQEQRAIAMSVLEPIRKRSQRLYAVKGTESHVGNIACDEESIAREVGFDGIGKQAAFEGDPKRKTQYELRLEWGPHHVCFRHHIGGGRSLAGQLTQLAGEMAHELHDAEKWDISRADLMFFAHVHTAKWGGMPTHRGPIEAYVSPSWQGTTAYGKRIGYSLGTVGGYVCSYDNNGFYVRKFVWPVPRNGSVPLRFKPKVAPSISSKSSRGSRPTKRQKTRKASSRQGKSPKR